MTHAAIATLLGEVGMDRRAETFLGRAHALQTDLLGHNHQIVLATLISHSKVMIRMKKYIEADGHRVQVDYFDKTQTT